jgi:LacI family transcriptional regulator, repressor for deo operon, udp, cdd, tsx, nupC, and nupG
LPDTGSEHGEENDHVAGKRLGPATQRDVAARAGVSRRTVSNVINDFPYVSEQTRDKVREALAELGYAPNLVARNLRNGRTGMIALVLPLDVPYFSELTEYIIDEARARSYAVLIDKTDGDPDREREFLIRGERSALFDGVIFSPSSVEMSDLSGRSSTSPVVLLGQRIRGGAFDHVIIDNVAAAATATRHLIELGRSRIAFIGARTRSKGDIPSDRASGYRAALRGAGYPALHQLEISAPGFRGDAGAESMARLLDLPDRPDAVFCYNDPLALGAMRTVLDRGLRVPEDVAIVGFDDSEDGRFTTPTLTTISQDKRQIARYAVDLLVSRLGGDTSPPVTRHADWRLVTRESTLGRC